MRSAESHRFTNAAFMATPRAPRSSPAVLERSMYPWSPQVVSQLLRSIQASLVYLPSRRMETSNEDGCPTSRGMFETRPVCLQSADQSVTTHSL